MNAGTHAGCKPAAASIVILPLTIAAAASSSSAGGNDLFVGPNVPLPSSALMGLLIIGGIAAFARFPGHRRKRSQILKSPPASLSIAD